MKKFLCALLTLSLLLLLAACNKGGDCFSVLRPAFFADISGELNGVTFSATVEAAAATPDTPRPLTLTFYAPSSLCGTVLRRDAEGRITLEAEGVTLADGTEGFAPLLSLFPTEGEVSEISLTDEGHTLVRGERFLLEFLADGTPVRVENSAVSATVVRFEAK